MRAIEHLGKLKRKTFSGVIHISCWHPCNGDGTDSESKWKRRPVRMIVLVKLTDTAYARDGDCESDTDGDGNGYSGGEGDGQC